MEGQVAKIKFSQYAVILLFVLAGVALAIKDFMARVQASMWSRNRGVAVHPTRASDTSLPLPRTGYHSKS